MPEIKGDYQGKLKTIKCTADAKLETVSAIDAGTNIIGNIDRVATVGQIDHLGTVERVKHINSLGTVHEGHLHTYNAGVWEPVRGTAYSAFTMPGAIYNNVVYYMQCNANQELRTAPGYDGSGGVPLLTDTDKRLKTAPATSRKGVVQTVANKGTAVALVASSTPVIGVIVKAQHENLGTIYVGDSTVDDTHGFLLRRDEFVSFSCQNAGSVFIDASRNAQKVSALYINY